MTRRVYSAITHIGVCLKKTKNIMCHGRTQLVPAILLRYACADGSYVITLGQQPVTRSLTVTSDVTLPGW